MQGTLAYLNTETLVVHLTYVLHRDDGTDPPVKYPRVGLCGALLVRATHPVEPQAIRPPGVALEEPRPFVRVDEATFREERPDARVCGKCSSIWRPPRRQRPASTPTQAPGKEPRPAGRLMDTATIAREYGISRTAAEAIMRRIPKVEIEGLRKVYVQRVDVENYISSRLRS